MTRACASITLVWDCECRNGAIIIRTSSIKINEQFRDHENLRLVPSCNCTCTPVKGLNAEKPAREATAAASVQAYLYLGLDYHRKGCSVRHPDHKLQKQYGGRSLGKLVGLQNQVPDIVKVMRIRSDAFIDGLWLSSPATFQRRCSSDC